MRNDIQKSGLRSSWPALSWAANLGEEVDRLFGQFDTPFSQGFTPATDVEETEEGYLVSFDIPGVPEDRIHIEVHDHTLRVSGERNDERKTNEKNVYRVERNFGRFERTFTLPNDVDTDAIEANYEHGVLKLFVPKGEKAKPRTISVKAKEGGFFNRLMGKTTNIQQPQKGA
jgi:HSP20 family protein